MAGGQTLAPMGVHQGHPRLRLGHPTHWLVRVLKIPNPVGPQKNRRQNGVLAHHHPHDLACPKTPEMLHPRPPAAGDSPPRRHRSRHRHGRRADPRPQAYCGPQGKGLRPGAWDEAADDEPVP